MVLIILFALSGRPPYCKGLATDSFFAAITDSSASLRRKDIMRSGLCPPFLASGVICPALRYCNTQCGTEAACNVCNYVAFCGVWWR